MRNKFNYNELVMISGNGKLHGNVKKEFGFIIEKDMIYKDYYVELFNKKKDWFSEKNIKRVFENKKTKQKNTKLDYVLLKMDLNL